MAETFILAASRLKQLGDVDPFSMLVLDAIISEGHTIENEITKHPVETPTGAGRRTDHARSMPRVFSMEGIASDSHLGVLAGDQHASADDEGNALEVYRQLEKLADDHAFITIITGLRVYNDMVIETIDIQRDINTGKALRFSATFSQVTLVSTKVTENIKETVKAKTHRAFKKKKVGKQPTKPLAASPTPIATPDATIMHRRSQLLQGTSVDPDAVTPTPPVAGAPPRADRPINNLSPLLTNAGLSDGG